MHIFVANWYELGAFCVLCNFRFESQGVICNKTLVSSTNRGAVIPMSVVVPVLLVVVLVVSYFFWRQKRKPNGAHPLACSVLYLYVFIHISCTLIYLLLQFYVWHLAQSVSTTNPARDQQLEKALGSGKDHGGRLKNTDNRRFTYKDLEKFTNNFKRFIGQGGFGPVYYGHLEDDTEVAIKMRSESSSHGSRGTKNHWCVYGSRQIRNYVLHLSNMVCFLYRFRAWQRCIIGI